MGSALRNIYPIKNGSGLPEKSKNHYIINNGQISLSSSILSVSWEVVNSRAPDFQCLTI